MLLKKHRHIKPLLFIIVVTLFWTCSPKFSYGVRTFLFDGVPNPYEVEVSVINDSLNIADGTSVNEIPIAAVARNVFNLHQPYKEKECSSCHNRNSMGMFMLPLPELCNQCHEDFNETYKVLHGPVASGDCTQCHNPHQSKIKNLLLRSGQELCLNCHNTTMVFANTDHEGEDETSCIECHNPHGGDNDKFLFK